MANQEPSRLCQAGCCPRLPTRKVALNPPAISTTILRERASPLGSPEGLRLRWACTRRPPEASEAVCRGSWELLLLLPQCTELSRAVFSPECEALAKQVQEQPWEGPVPYGSLRLPAVPGPLQRSSSLASHQDPGQVQLPSWTGLPRAVLPSNS